MPTTRSLQAAPTPTSSTGSAQRLGRLSVLAALAVAVSGCSVLQEDRIDYRGAAPARTLDVPPDLTQLSRDSRFTVPGAAVSALQMAPAAQAVGATTAVAAVGDVRIERLGNQRWLVVNRPPEQLWGPLRGFWQEHGFALEIEQEKLGIMETGWAENRADIPQDFIRRTIGRFFENLYSTAERDRFRTRLERNDAGGTEIYISHRGMIEVFSSAQQDQTMWQPRPADAELEAEFLRRLMLTLGVPQAQAQAAIAGEPAPAPARLASVNGVSVLQFTDNFDRAWRRIGLSLDRTGFTVEDRNRDQGIYFVRYVAPDTAPTQPGLLSRWIGRAPPQAAPLSYRVWVRSADNQTAVSVLDAQGQPTTSVNAQRILQLLADDLK